MAGSDISGWSLLGMGTTSAACLVVPMGLGYLLDRLFDTLPVLLLVGLVIGIATCARYVYTIARRLSRS